MNGIERITARISSDSQAEIDAVLDGARKEAERITADFRKRAEREAYDLRAKNDRDAQAREERLISAAEMDARKTILAAKQEMVEQAYALALDKLCAMPEKKRVPLLAKLLERSSTTGEETAVFSAKDAKRAGPRAVEEANNASGKHLTLSEETAPIRGGFILKDRNVEVNCSFETLVRLERTQTAGTVAKLLFP